MRNKKTFNLVLMLSILVIHTFTLSYWLSNESKGLSKKTENTTKLNFDKRNVIPVLKVDSNGRKSLNSSSSLRQ
jgi:hypothetical protein